MQTARLGTQTSQEQAAIRQRTTRPRTFHSGTAAVHPSLDISAQSGPLRAAYFQRPHTRNRIHIRTSLYTLCLHSLSCLASQTVNSRGAKDDTLYLERLLGTPPPQSLHTQPCHHWLNPCHACHEICVRHCRVLGSRTVAVKTATSLSQVVLVHGLVQIKTNSVLRLAVVDRFKLDQRAADFNRNGLVVGACVGWGGLPTRHTRNVAARVFTDVGKITAVDRVPCAAKSGTRQEQCYDVWKVLGHRHGRR